MNWLTVNWSIPWNMHKAKTAMKTHSTQGPEKTSPWSPWLLSLNRNLFSYGTPRQRWLGVILLNVPSRNTCITLLDTTNIRLAQRCQHRCKSKDSYQTIKNNYYPILGNTTLVRNAYIRNWTHEVMFLACGERHMGKLSFKRDDPTRKLLSMTGCSEVRFVSRRL